MSSQADIDPNLRQKILSQPDVILDDQDVMRALIAANEKTMGGNIVDLRGIAMERLEARLGRLEDTHRSVIAAAYDNLAGTNQVHRAVLRMLDPVDFSGFISDLRGDVADILRVEAVRLVLESHEADGANRLNGYQDIISVVETGFVDEYITYGRNVPVRSVTLRPLIQDHAPIYGDASEIIGSEACIKLDFGPNRLPGMLLLGAEDPHQFNAQQGTDLLAFFGGIFERTMRRWLS